MDGHKIYTGRSGGRNAELVQRNWAKRSGDAVYKDLG